MIRHAAFLALMAGPASACFATYPPIPADLRAADAVALGRIGPPGDGGTIFFVEDALSGTITGQVTVRWSAVRGLPPPGELRPGTRRILALHRTADGAWDVTSPRCRPA